MKIALVGSPNVGKSVIFHHLTGQYVIVSNYPGTTVEVTFGEFKWGEAKVEVVDTPGIYSLLPISGEEMVTRDLLWAEKPELVLHIIDAKNLQRMLGLTIQLLEAGLPVVMVLNMMDEARERGLKIDISLLAAKLGIPIFPTVSTTGEGIKELKIFLGKYLLTKEKFTGGRKFYFTYSPEIEHVLVKVSRFLKGNYPFSKRSIALLLLENDQKIKEIVQEIEGEKNYQCILAIIEPKEENSHFSYEIIIIRQKKVEQLLQQVFDTKDVETPRLQELLSQLCIWPVTGIPILFFVLYFGIYRFVGGLGGGVLVNFLDGVVFQQWLNPFFTFWINKLISSQGLRILFIGDYGIFTLGLRYAVAIILPVVGMFFFAFSILEDSGYFPRLALLIDQIFKFIGLNGRAVIPMILGLGCDTMATLTTRILETRRERLIAILLLALAVPCSAQLGVITGLLSQEKGGMIIWLVVVLGTFLLIGYLANKLIPGEVAGFYIEVPNLRWPKLGNIIIKTGARMKWYFFEILPLFIYSSVIIWLGQMTGFFIKLLSWLEPIMATLGLPKEAAVSFIFGFFRRDYGAAGLYDLYQAQSLSGEGLIVACVTLTLFVPCVAQFVVMLKELGWKAGLLISSFIFPFAFFVGWIVHLFLGLF